MRYEWAIKNVSLNRSAICTVPSPLSKLSDCSLELFLLRGNWKFKLLREFHSEENKNGNKEDGRYGLEKRKQVSVQFHVFIEVI